MTKSPAFRTVILLSSLMAGHFGLFSCGDNSTGSTNGNGDPVVNYFPLFVGYNARYQVFDHAGRPFDTTRFAIINTFNAADYSGYVALDSTSAGINTLWLVASADTVFMLTSSDDYLNRRPLVRNRLHAEFSWLIPFDGDIESPDRYAVFVNQLPETEPAFLTGGRVYYDCSRTVVTAVYEQSGKIDTLGSEYFAPNVGRVLSSFRTAVDDEILYWEIIP